MSALDLFAPAPASGPPVTVVRGWAAALPFEMVRDSVPWQQHGGVMYDKPYLRPRLECWFHDDPTRGYAFGGGEPIAPTPMAASRVVARVRLRLLEQGHGDFTSCFANLYRSGADSISWHADDEAWIGPVIASVSFGETRVFRMKPKPGCPGEPVTFELAHGDLLVMHQGCQDSWLHCLPKTRKPKQPRVNLTFRMETTR